MTAVILAPCSSSHHGKAGPVLHGEDRQANRQRWYGVQPGEADFSPWLCPGGWKSAFPTINLTPPSLSSQAAA